MFTKIEHFLTTFDHEKAATQKVMSALTDGSLQQCVTPGHRTLGRMAWHLITTYPEMTVQMGVELTSVTKESPVPAKASDIADAYRIVSEHLANYVKSNWTDETLDKADNMYGEEWKRGISLSVLIRHEAHHRGQMTVLMRQAGLVVPDVYGPAKEGWVNYGMNAPEV